MKQNTRDVLGWVTIAGIIVFAIAVWNFTAAYSRSVPPMATFAVTGQGKAIGVPDVAEFTFSITNEGGKDVASLQNSNTAKANAAIDYLKSQGVDPKDIETQGYNIEPRYQSYSCPPTVYNQAVIAPAPASLPGNGSSRNGAMSAGSGGTAAGSSATAGAPMMAMPAQPCPPAQVVGYTVSETIQVKVRDFSKTGDIISGVTGKGATSVSGLNFTVDNPSALQGDARAKAIADAKAQAESMAKAGSFELGRLVRVDENGSSPVAYKSYAMDSVGAGMATAPTPAPVIQPGSQELNAEVTLTYEIR